MGADGLLGQNFHPRIHLTESDFASITDGGILCDSGGFLGPAEFEAAMRKQVDCNARMCFE